MRYVRPVRVYVHVAAVKESSTALHTLSYVTCLRSFLGKDLDLNVASVECIKDVDSLHDAVLKLTPRKDTMIKSA